MFKKMLLATDGSENAMRACSDAGRMAKAFGAELTLIYVVYLPPLYKSDVGSGIQQTLVEDGEKILRDSKKEADAQGIDAKTELVREGHPADVLVKKAKAEGYDLIVMGSSGMGRAAGLELGSVSSSVLDRAHCSVLVVR